MIDIVPDASVKIVFQNLNVLAHDHTVPKEP